jgi:hypothetical protein
MNDTLRIYTIYWNPRDFPLRYVARGHRIDGDRSGPDSEPVAVVASLEAVRAAIRRVDPRVNVRFPRADADEPQIVESWM